MDKKTVDIVITSCNNISLLKDVLRSISRQSFKDFNCIVVNDNNNLETERFIDNNFPWVTFIGIIGRNGPAGNRNIAILKGRSDLIVTLDDDVVLGFDWLEKMVRIMNEEKDVGIAEAIYPFFGNFYHRQYCCTAGMIFRRKLFADVGGFDKDYFYALEDTDFSLAAIAKDWKIKPQCNAYAWHKGSVTVFNKLNTDFRLFHFWKNYLMTLIKHEPKRNLIVMLPVLVCRLLLIEIKTLILWRGQFVIPKAIWWNILNLKKNLRKRQFYRL